MSTIHFTSNINDHLKLFLSDHDFTNIAVLVDENTRKYCLPTLAVAVDLTIEIPSGEENKTLNTCTHIWEQLTEASFDRKSLMINLGGGVIGDMGGFCAATYKRGISFINIPTTLLAQVDASVGGKLGIDFSGFKNHIGVFEDPAAVFIDTTFLTTLPQRELQSGFAEVIKHHLIADNIGWQRLITKNRAADQSNWDELVQHSVKIKSAIVKNDRKETGQRKLLNFGHTIGHAIESYYLPTKRKLLHGEAVAIGMICESYLSHTKGYINKQSLDEIINFIKINYEPFSIDAIDGIVKLVSQDKKNEGEKILCVLLNKIGKGCWDQQITEADIRTSLLYFNQI